MKDVHYFIHYWNRLTSFLRETYFRRLMHAYIRLNPARPPTRKELILMKIAWCNPGFTASVDYLLDMSAVMMQCNGPILECGSGFTTVLCGVLAKQRKLELVSLEHRQASYQYLAGLLSELKLTNVNLKMAPLKDYGDFEWYDFKEKPPSDFDFIICDGPPWYTKGGRLGLIPVMLERLHPKCKILLDDVHRRNERQILNRWAEIVAFNYHVKGRPFSFAEITLESSLNN